jgi:hypothetical protein
LANFAALWDQTKAFGEPANLFSACRHFVILSSCDTLAANMKEIKMPKRSEEQRVGNVVIYFCIAITAAVSLYVTFIAA